MKVMEEWHETHESKRYFMLLFEPKMISISYEYILWIYKSKIIFLFTFLEINQSVVRKLNMFHILAMQSMKYIIWNPHLN